MKKLKLLLLFILLISIKSTYAQFNRTINNDTIYYSGNNWNTKIGNQLIPFDSTLIVVKFNKLSSHENIISYLQANQMVLIDSLYDYKLCRLNNSISLSRNIDSLTSSDFFEYTELNTNGIINSVDPLFRNQLHINPVNFISSLNVTNNNNLDSAWHYSRGNSNIIVSVIDAYPDWSHVDIGMGSDGHENVWKNPAEDAWLNPNDPTTGDSIDNDGNGLIDDWKGWDFFNNSNDVRPRTIYDVHGTKVSGIIGAKTNNSVGGAGIAGGNYLLTSGKEGVQLMTINICTSNADGSAKSAFSIWNLAEAIDYSAKHKAKIIALSLSTSRTDDITYLKEIISKAKHEYNCTIFCSSGNNLNNDLIEYPSSDVNVYSVGAVDIYGRINKYNLGDYNLNKKMDFVANAANDDIVTTSVNNTYVSNFGQTSAASPQASGVAALLYSYIPCANDEIIYDVMKITANKLGIPDSFIYDNNTNSNRYGYGIPDATEAILLLKSYIINNHLITSNTTWNSPRIATADIKVTSGYTLTVKSTLIMSENTKIIVEAGGNLIVDSGNVTSTCGWKGIEVFGLPNVEQNSNTFGEVKIRNNGKIEGAWIGIHSINGGIVKTSSNAVFRNNDQSIFIDKYMYDHDSSNISLTKFISDGPFLPATNYETGTFHGVHNFIRLIDTRYLTIDTCNFENTYGLQFYEQANAINAFGVHVLKIERSNFKGMYKACEIVGYGGFKNQVFVNNCNFSNVLQGIRFANLDVFVFDNTFELAYVNSKLYPLSELYHSFGVYSHGCINSISRNSFSSENTKSYGLVIRNSRNLYDSYIDLNTFTNLKYGTQIEQYNRKLFISCNYYLNNTSSAWSVNPFFVGNELFPMQGSVQSGSGHKRAGNLFFDRELTTGSLRHIRTSVDFIYNAANDPLEGIPEYVSSLLTINQFNEINNCTGSGDRFLIKCGETNCSSSQLIYLLSLNKDPDSIDIYKKAILNELTLHKRDDDAFDYIDEWNDNAVMNEYFFESNLNLKKYTQAESMLFAIDTSLDRDLDYFHFYSIILNQYKNNLDRDSLTSSQLSTIEDIATRTNDVSDLAMAYLNFYNNGAYLMNPEEWEEESSRPVNSEVTPSLKPLKNEKNNIFSFSLFPNPTVHETFILINTKNAESVFNIEIIDAIGNLQLEISKVLPNEKYKLNTNTFPAGVYTVKVIDENNTIINKRLVILR